MVSPSLQSYSSALKERGAIDTTANSFLKLLDAERLRSFPQTLQTNSLQHRMPSWRTSPERQPGFSSQERTSGKLMGTVLLFWEAHCFKAAQHKMRKQENLAAIAFSQFPAPWTPNPSQARGSQTGELMPGQTETATSEQSHEHQPRGTAAAPLRGGCARRAKSGDPLLEEAGTEAPISAQEL